MSHPGTSADAAVTGSRVADGTAVVVCPPEQPATVPAAALPWLRACETLYAAHNVPSGVVGLTGAEPAPGAQELLNVARHRAVVLLAAHADDAGADVLARATAPVIEAARPPLLEAVRVMDRLRSPGGCPWDAEQTHESLRQYLVEETYELLEAIESGGRDALREELGDVLLQVLFHARLAVEHPTEPFDIHAVADELVGKLMARHPYLFAEATDADSVDTAEVQQHRWEELKQAQKSRESVVEGVALGQPAVALAAKLAQRSARAGVPEDLLPHGEDIGNQLFRLTARAHRTGVEPEGALRAAAKQFISDVYAAESAARAEGVEPATLDEAGWRRYWPTTHLGRRDAH